MRKKLKNKRLITGLFILCIVLGTILIAYGLLSTQKEAAKGYKIIVIPKIIDEGNGFWSTLIAGAQLGAEENQVKLEVVGSESEEDIEGQIDHIRKSIKKKPDAMVVSPSSFSETTEALKEVVDSGIKLVLIDSVIDKSISDSIVATDNFEAGKKLGEFTATYLKGDSQIGIVNHVKGVSTSIQREQGMKTGLGIYKKQVMETVFCGSSYEKAYDLTKEMLAKYPQMKVIMGTNEYAAVGAARAIKDIGVAGTVKIVGFDNSIEEIQLMEAGVFQGIVIQKPFNIGYLGVEQAVNLLEGRHVVKNIDSGCKLITKENMYEEESQRLLYPFTGQQ